ncbi:hypothetical protein HDU91_002264 [Kappamyces sp. JEL0680]|nr:hypothetical protein HDU91_002264 [Kappamyces sp. JEL0680]
MPSCHSSRSRFSSISSELAINFPRNPKDWTYWTFFSMRVLDTNGQSVSLLDYYFQTVHLNIPCLSKAWVENHFADLPLYLLHAMYACCGLPRKRPTYYAARNHYYYAMKLVQLELEDANPMTVLAMIHLAFFGANASVVNASSVCLALAIRLAQYLGFHHQVQIFWRSPIGTILGADHATGPSFIKCIWIFCYIVDYQCFALTGHPLKIEEHEEAGQILVSPNVGHPSNIPENMLTFVDSLLPQITAGRKLVRYYANREGNLKQILDQCEQLFEWAPFIIRYHPVQNCILSKYQCYFNAGTAGALTLVYHSTRLRLIKQDIVLCASANNWSPSVMNRAYESSHTLTALAQIFLERLEFDTMDYILFKPLYIAALVHILLNSQNLLGIVNLHVQARAQFFPGLRDDDLFVCLHNRSRALHLLDQLDVTA